MVISHSYCKPWKLDQHFLFKVEELYCELNYHDQKIRRRLTHDILKHWTDVSTLLGLICSVYRELPRWRSNQQPQIAEPRLYNWATAQDRAQVTPRRGPGGDLVLCKEYGCNLQDTFRLIGCATTMTSWFSVISYEILNYLISWNTSLPYSVKYQNNSREDSLIHLFILPTNSQWDRLVKNGPLDYLANHGTTNGAPYKGFVIIIMSRRQHGYPWPSLATSPYHSSPPAGLQGYIPCPHIVAVCKFVLVVLLLHIHMWGSTGVHRLWARTCFSSSVPRVWFVELV